MSSVWVVTEGMREETYRLARLGKPYPEPKIAHIMWEVACAMVDRYLGQLIPEVVGILLVVGGAVWLVVAGQAVLIIPLVLAAVVGGGFAVKAAKVVVFWDRVRRANSSAR